MLLPNGMPLFAATGTVMILVLLVVIIASAGIALGVMLAPAIFMLWRVFTRDNLARWVTTSIIAVLIGAMGWQLYHPPGSELPVGGLALAGPSDDEVVERIIKYQEHTSYRTVGGLGWCVIAIALLHLPSSNRWFRKVANDA